MTWAKPPIRRRVRVFRSPCCGVVSPVTRKDNSDPVPFEMCFQCFMAHQSESIESWLQDLMLVPLGTAVQPTAPAGR